MSLDLLGALRDAIMSNADITALLDQWKGEPAIFTRRPFPSDAPDLAIGISAPASISDADGLTSDRPIVTHDIAVYGRRGQPGVASDQTRTVEAIGFMIREQFHRKKFSMQPTGFYVIDVLARGPMIAPVDDEQTVGRLVSLTVRLRRQE
jgi:hypothetical protein